MMSDRPTRLPGVVTKPMAWVYAFGAAHKARQFDRGQGVVQLDRPVISIGNLSAGGTGKTPMVHHVVRVLLDAGRRPVIAMRGYKAEPGTLGDEALEHQGVFADVPLVVQPDRSAGLKALLATPEGSTIDCVVLDDGFQHRQIARDLDIVLIDASRPPDRDALLPHGFLREPIAALRRADAFVLTHTEMVDESEVYRLGDWLEEHAGRRPVASAEHRWTGLDVHQGEGTQAEETGWLDGRRVLVVCAIGNPKGVLAGVEHHGGILADTMALADHQRYDSKRVEQIQSAADRAGAEVVVTTQKDWVKLQDFRDDFPCPIVVPRLNLGFGDSQENLDCLIRTAGGVDLDRG